MTNQGLELAREWYSASLPKKMDSSFASFAAKSASLAFRIAPGHVRVDGKSPTAYIDANGITYLPAKYFDPKYFINELKIEPQDVPAAAILVINGSTIHEAFHRLWTAPFLVLPKTVDAYLSSTLGAKATEESNWLINRYTSDQIDNAASQYIREVSRHGFETEKYNVGSKLAKAITVLDNTTIFCLQLIEDIYNENRGRLEFEVLSRFINSKNSILLGEYEFLKRKETCDEKLSLEAICNLLVTLKCIDNRDQEIFHEGFMESLYEMIMSCQEPYLNTVQRATIAVKLSKMLQQNDDIDQTQQPQSGDGCQFTIDLDSDPQDSSDEDSRNKGNEISRMFEAALIEGEIKNMKIDDDATLMPGKDYDLQKIAKVAVIDVMKNSGRRSPKTIEFDDRFIRFADILRYSLESKHVYGPVRDRGPEISKKFLNQIAHSTKIFTRKDVIGRDKGKPEVALLCDWSGSMTHKRVKGRDGSDDYLHTAALKAAYGAHISMNRSGVPNAIYSHTTGSDTDDEAPVLYAISAYDMPFTYEGGKLMSTRNVADRFGYAATYTSSENYDGFAIRETTKHFSNRDNDKILIVLSDGQPSATHYNNTQAVEHTKLIVKILRRDGIKVFSMSLIRDVVEINDYIYGEAFNMRAFGNNLTQNMELALRKAVLM